MRIEFDRSKYRPSTEQERKRQESKRNQGRMRGYEARQRAHALPSALREQTL